MKLKRFSILLGVLIASAVSVQADCIFNYTLAANSARSYEAGGAGEAVACLFINANAEAFGMTGCISGGYYYDTVTGDVCYDPPGITDYANPYGLGIAIISSHPNFMYNNLSGINWLSSYPPPGMYITYTEWNRMRTMMQQGYSISPV